MAPGAFEHPLDRAALDVLRRTPGLDTLFKKLASLHFERQVRLYFTVDSLRLGPRQRPRIHQLLKEASDVLDLPSPELFLMQNPSPNALAIGMDRHTIVVTSALTDLLDDDELRAVLGHELGHIKSGHMLYRTIAIFLSLIGIVAARNLPFVNLLTQALLYAFYDWSRKSELTADRAGLLVSQDDKVSARVLLKLAGGSKDLDGPDPSSLEEFLRQADDYEEMSDSLLDALYKFEMTRFQTHPFPAIRAREITRWAASDDYHRILSGNYARTSPEAGFRRCGSCGASVANSAYRFCPECGAAI